MRILVPGDQWTYDVIRHGEQLPSDVYKTQVIQVLSSTSTSPANNIVQNMQEHVVYASDGHWKDYIHHFTQDSAGTLQYFGADFVDDSGITPGWVTTPVIGYTLWFPDRINISTAWDVSYTETMNGSYPGPGTYTKTTNKTYAVVEVETITVKAGTFETFKAPYINRAYVHQGTAWIAPQIGAVVKDEYVDNSDTIITQELTSFTLHDPISDSTPPTTPIVIDDGMLSYGNCLHASWSSQDTESGISEYQVIVSTTPDEAGIPNGSSWASLGTKTEETSPSLSLVEGQTYYILVKAINGDGLASAIGASDGIQVSLSGSGNDIFPLQVGNLTRYNVHKHGNDIDGSINISSSQVVSGNTRYSVDIDLDGQMTMVLGKLAGGIFMYSKGEYTFTTPCKAFAQPVSVNSTWKYTEPDGTTTYKVLSTTASVTVPAGTFNNCILAKETWSSYPDEFGLKWFVPGIGIVKMTYYDENNYLYETDEMTGWHIAQPASTDTTPPTTPVVTDDGAFSYGNSLHATWSSTDDQSNIASYQFAVSATTDADGIIEGGNWTSMGNSTNDTRYGLPLEEGQTYYILIKACNTAGLWSSIGVSDGIVAKRKLPGSDLFPLQVGNCINYIVTDNDTTYNGYIQIPSSSVVSKVTRFNIEGYLDQPFSVILGRLSDGVYQYANNGETYSTPAKFLAQPVSTGDKWSFTRSGTTTTMEILSDSEDIEVPAGIFTNCVHLKQSWSTDPDGWSEWWLAPGIGLIKIQNVGSETDYYTSAEMSSWHLMPLSTTDTTPPTTPIITDDGNTFYGNCLHGKWSSTDAQSGIAGYMVCISTTPNETGILGEMGWVDVGLKNEDTSPGLPLVDGQAYYILAKAQNNAGLWSSLGVSDGIIAKSKKPGNDYWPLSLGYKATFDVWDNEIGNFKGTMSIDSTKVIKGVTTYVMSYNMGEPSDAGSFAIAKSGNTIYKYAYADADNKWTNLPTPQVVSPGDANLGSKWSSQERIGVWIESEIVSIDDTVSVPAGVFTNCAKVKNTLLSDGDYWYTWSAPGVGMIKFLDDGPQGVSDSWELSSYLYKVTPDTTAPSKPVVTLDSAVVTGSTVSANWRSTDIESGITEYQAAISTSPDAKGVLSRNETPWQSFGTDTSGELTTSSLLTIKKYYVIVKAKNGDGLWSLVGASAAFTVTKAVGSVVITPASPMIRAGAKQQFTAKVYDVDGGEMTGKKITWSCEGGSIVSANGLYTAPTTPNNCFVSATVTGTQITDETEVEVTVSDLSKVVISPSTTEVVAGEDKTFTAKVYDKYNNEISDAVITWSIKVSKAGSITAGGVFTAGLIPGKYPSAVTATCGTKQAMALVTVIPQPPSRIEITPALGQIEVGKTQKFSAIAYDTNNNPITGLKFAWSVSSPSIGKISNGTFTAAKVPANGSIRVTAMLGTEEYGEPGSININIIAGAPAKVVMSEASITLNTSQQRQFSADVFDKFNNQIDANLTWSLSNASAGTLSNDGAFTAGNTAGTYYVNAKAGNITGKVKVKIVKRL